MPGRPVSVTQSVGGVGQNAVVQPSATSAQRPKFLPEHIDDPKILARKLNDAVAYHENITAPARSSPSSTGIIVRNVSLTGGQSTAIKHGLGYAPQNYVCVRAQTAAWSVFDVANAAGLPLSHAITLFSNNTGKYDIHFY